MGWERRERGSWYYTRSRRADGRVVREYVGGGELGALAELMDQEEREERLQASKDWKAEKERLSGLDARLGDVDTACRRLVAACLLLSGYHQHKGQWRQCRD